MLRRPCHQQLARLRLRPGAGGLGAAAISATIAAAGSPALAFGPGGLLLAYRDRDGFQAQQLGADGARRGPPQPIRPSAAAGAQLVALTPTSSGYAVAVATAPERPSLERLDPSGQVIPGPPIIAGGSGAELASDGELVGMAWVASDREATAAVVGPGIAPTSSATLSTDARSYGRVAIAGAGGKFGVTWSDFAGFIGYRALAADGTAEGT